MIIDIKKSLKPVKYNEAIHYLEKRLIKVNNNEENELIWILEHNHIYTAGTSYNESEILDKEIKLIKTNRGGKITHHCPGQIICYFVIDLKKRKKDIRKFITLIEKTIIQTLQEFNISSFSDSKNIGIWVWQGKEVKKISAIGIRVSKWIAYHGFSINVDNDLDGYNNIVPCGIKDKGIINLKLIKDQDYKKLKNRLIDNLIKNLEI
jgi:lipoyl(octanoyl) transferase